MQEADKLMWYKLSEQCTNGIRGSAAYTNLFCIPSGDVPLQARCHCHYKQVCAWQARMLRERLRRQPHLQGAPLKQFSSSGVLSTGAGKGKASLQHAAREASLCLEISQTTTPLTIATLARGYHAVAVTVARAPTSGSAHSVHVDLLKPCH
eukprot:1900675-Amphidinium_carterae.4